MATAAVLPRLYDVPPKVAVEPDIANVCFTPAATAAACIFSIVRHLKKYSVLLVCQKPSVKLSDMLASKFAHLV